MLVIFISASFPEVGFTTLWCNEYIVMLQLRCEGLVQCRVILTPEICVLLCSICGGSGGPKINASYGLVIRDINIK